MKRSLFGLVAAMAVLFTVGRTSVQAIDPVVAQTWVGGTIFDASNNPVPGGNPGDMVTVVCNGHLLVVPFDASGNYAAIFPQNRCKVGDSASASVAVPEGSGSTAGVVQNTEINGPVVDLDVVVLNITVPELGLIGMGVAGMASAAGYLYMKGRAAVGV